MTQIDLHGVVSRRELLEARERTHRRLPHEYERPQRELRTTTWEVARTFPLDDDRDFNDIPLRWAGVRGALYADPSCWFHPPGTWVETWGELVPEPFNAHDDHALAIDLDGSRLGYASARYAYYAHAMIATLNSTGTRVLVPLQYRCDYDRRSKLLIASAFAAFPTFPELNKLLPSDEVYVRLLDPLWEALDEPVREQIARDGFHLTSDTLPHLIALRHRAPEAGLPSTVRLGAVPRGVERYLAEKRYERQRAEDARIRKRNETIVADFHDGWKQVDIARRQGVSPAVVSRALQKAGVDTRAPRIDPEQRRVRAEIVSLLKDGKSRREISEALGVSARTITIAAQDAGVDLPSDAGVNDYSRRKMRERLELCQQAVKLQSEGLTRAEIARRLEVSSDMAKLYLADGRFFTDPSANGDRLDAARHARATGMTASQAGTNQERRAIRDANMLDLIGDTWR
ncbi:helix-turn-helix domain-containing protein [Brachybacterium paraconglomeratum]